MSFEKLRSSDSLAIMVYLAALFGLGCQGMFQVADNAKLPKEPERRSRATGSHNGKSEDIVVANDDPRTRTSEGRERVVNERQDQDQDRVSIIGQRLVDVAREPKIKFRFDTLVNPRPDTRHLADGSIYVSSGLANAASDSELAAALSVQMAELILESRNLSDEPVASLPDAGPDDEARNRAMASKTGRAKRIATREEIDALAGKLLEKAGYAVDLSEVRSKLETRAVWRKTPVLRATDLSGAAN